MRTTLNVDDQLLAAAKQRAVEEKISLMDYFENALRESLSRSRAEQLGTPISRSLSIE